MPAYKSRSSDQTWQLYGGRLLVTAPATVVVTPKPDDPNPLNAELAMRLDIVSGRLACVQLCVESLPGGPPITSDILRTIPVSRLVAEAAEWAGIVIEPNKAGRYNLLDYSGFAWPPADFASDGPTDEALDHAARVYAFCMASGLNPNAELLKRYGIPKPTASRWISTARRRGILVDTHRRNG